MSIERNGAAPGTPFIYPSGLIVGGRLFAAGRYGYLYGKPSLSDSPKLKASGGSRFSVPVFSGLRTSGQSFASNPTSTCGCRVGGPGPGDLGPYLTANRSPGVAGRQIVARIV